MDSVDLVEDVIPQDADGDWFNPGPNARWCEQCQDFQMMAVLKQSTNTASTSTIIPTCPQCHGVLVWAEL